MAISLVFIFLVKDKSVENESAPVNKGLFVDKEIEVSINNKKLDKKQSTIVVGDTTKTPYFELSGYEKKSVFLDEKDINFPNNKKEYNLPYYILPVKHNIKLSDNDNNFDIFYLLHEKFNSHNSSIPRTWVIPESTPKDAWLIGGGKLSFVSMPNERKQVSFASRYKLKKNIIVEFTFEPTSQNFWAGVYFLNNKHTIFFKENIVGIKKKIGSDVQKKYKFYKNKKYRIKITRQNGFYNVFVEPYGENSDFLHIFKTQPIITSEQELESKLDNFGFVSWNHTGSFGIDDVIFGEYE